MIQKIRDATGLISCIIQITDLNKPETEYVLSHIAGSPDHAAPQVLRPPADGHGQAEAVHRGRGHLHRLVTTGNLEEGD